LRFFPQDFIPVSGGGEQFKQCCKRVSKGNRILGFYWTNSTNIIFVTKHGVEMYAVWIDRVSLFWVLNEKCPVCLWMTYIFLLCSWCVCLKLVFVNKLILIETKDIKNECFIPIPYLLWS